VPGSYICSNLPDAFVSSIGIVYDQISALKYVIYLSSFESLFNIVIMKIVKELSLWTGICIYQDERLNLRLRDMSERLNLRLRDMSERLSLRSRDVSERLSQRLRDVSERLSQRLRDVSERLSQRLRDVSERLSQRDVAVP
jgi:vacuolar-type H+-ATPase subunit I/STV1